MSELHASQAKNITAPADSPAPRPTSIALCALVLAIAATLSVSPTARAQQITFAQAVRYDLAYPVPPLTPTWEPSSVAIADFNRDGRPDVVVTNETQASVSLLFGAGGGTFDPAKTATLAMGGKPLSVVVADLNRDGIPDIAVANAVKYKPPTGIPTVSYRLGKGDGSFGDLVSMVSGGCYSLAVGDLDLNGAPDLATIGPEVVSVFLGAGYGGTFAFAPLKYYVDKGVGRSITIADIDRNGKPDLVAAVNVPSKSVSLSFGNGSGTYSGQAAFLPTTAATGTWFLAVGDLDVDGKLDIATANANHTISILLGKGDGKFKDDNIRISLGGSAHPKFVAIADLNSDGKPDLIVSETSNGRITVLPGLGAGAFGQAYYFDQGVGPHGLAVGDLDFDGRLDLVVANRFINKVSVLRNTTSFDVAP